MEIILTNSVKGSRLSLASEERVPVKTPMDSAAFEILLLSLKALSQRAIVALSNLFTLLTCASAFWLWYSVLPNPNAYQLVGVALYGMFILLLHMVRKREG